VAESTASRPEVDRPWRALALCIARACRRLAGCCCDLARGAAGSHAYDQYLAHQRTHHPGAPALSREEFFRREFTARWEGIRRCC
jgi:uncharacterized short protein YbdD (DUF466 family)